MIFGDPLSSIIDRVTRFARIPISGRAGCGA